MQTIDAGAAPDAGGGMLRRLALLVILSSALGTSLTYSVIQPILPMLAAHFGGPGGERMAQFAVTTPAIGMLAAGLVAGWVLAAVGMRRLILISVVALGVTGAAGGLLDNPWAFLVSRLADGVSAVLFSTACVTLLAELYEGDARAKVMGALQGMGTFAAIPCVIGAGLLAQRFGWRAPFSFFAVFAVPVFLIALIAIRPAAAAASASPAGAKARGADLRRLWPYFLLVFGFSQLTTMGVTQLPFLLKEEGVSAAGPQSLILAANALTMGVGAVLAGPLQARIGEMRTLLAGVVVAGIGNLIAGLSHDAAISSAGSILSYAGCGVLLTLSFTLVLNRAAAEVRGVAVGFIQAAMFIGQFANPLLIAPLRAGLGLHGAYIVVGVLAITGPVLAAGVQGLRRRPAPVGA